jgi:hypothetical protein
MTMNTLPDSHARLGEYSIPGDAQVTRCKSCGSQIVWAKTGTGANLPLSLATIRVGADGNRYALIHFSDCSQATQHRKPTGQADEFKRLKNLIRRWRRQSEDHGPMAARAYLAAANDLEGEIKIILQTRKAS